MNTEAELYYMHIPQGYQPVPLEIDFLPVQEFLADEDACKALWDLIASQFRTRRKFLTVWPNVRHVAVYRDPESGRVAGLLLVSEPINWQIDYVVVAPEARHKGIASALVTAVLNRAWEQKVPYVMLTSREGLRPLYEGCGFVVVNTMQPA